jgi:membrane protein YdbS with pleckstrin-like domain
MSYVERNLAPGESVVYRARYHWIYYGTALLLLFFAFLLGLASIYSNRVSGGDASVPTVVGYMAVGFLLLAAAVFIVRRIRASADEYVVTNRRVVRKYGLVAREVEQALLEKIQDVTLRQGVIARLLGYGTIVVETASETGRLVFVNIANPEGMRTALWSQASIPGRGAASPQPAPAVASFQAPPMRPAIRERLAELEELKGRGLLTAEEYAAKRKEILGSL